MASAPVHAAPACCRRLVPRRATLRVPKRTARWSALNTGDPESRDRRPAFTLRALGTSDDTGEADGAVVETSHAFPPSLKTWRRVLRDVPLARILPRDSDFGAGMDDAVSAARDGATAERLAFFGDKILNAAVGRALYDRRGLTLSTGEMSILVARARSNQLFANLISKLLREDMVAATPRDAARLGRWHSVGTMVEAAAFLVHSEYGGDEAADAIAEVGAFLLAEAEAGPLASDATNHKGTLVELVAKGVPGSLRCKSVGRRPPDQEFEAVAELDGATATARARTKREAERRAARGVFEVLTRGGGGTHGRMWSGTPDVPIAPLQAFERDE